jgi:spore coat polysaccharide biosynthesis protein SpsF
VKVVAMVQARIGSTRLPGKVLKDLAGETMLARVVERLRHANRVDELLVATTDRPEDDAIVDECRRLSVLVSRGDQHDVLDRYFKAAQYVSADVVVRITADCPLIDPEITDKTIAQFLDELPDYASNTIVRTYPRGLDTEVISFSALSKAWQKAQKPYEREHVTPYLLEHSSEFRLTSVVGDRNYSTHRWTVDTPEDLQFAQTVYERLKVKGMFSWRDVLAELDREPELAELNRDVVQKAIH